MSLDTKFLEEQRHRLNDHKHGLLSELRSIGRPTAQDKENFVPIVDDIGTEEGEQAIEAEQLEISSSVEPALEDDLRDVDDALQKIEDGDYGICEDCGREIPRERLLALPQARLCMDCQE